MVDFIIKINFVQNHSSSFNSIFSQNLSNITYTIVENFVLLLLLVIIFCFLLLQVINFFHIKVQYSIVDLLYYVEFVQSVIEKNFISLSSLFLINSHFLRELLKHLRIMYTTPKYIFLDECIY